MAVRPRPSRAGERRLYALAASTALLVVLIGFARTYYLKFAFGTPPLSLLLQVHGAVMTAWFALFVAQATLVARGRVDLHRRLGVFGALLALAVLAIGTTVAITGARLGHAPPGLPPLAFLAVPLGDMLVFALLAGAALSLRRRGDFHKRLMLLASLSLLTAPLARIPLLQQGGIVACFSATLALVLACVAWDATAHRRLHPAFAWGAALVALSWPLRLALAGTPQWQAFAHWLAG
jgi:hypothetical protein